MLDSGAGGLIAPLIPICTDHGQQRRGNEPLNRFQKNVLYLENVYRLANGDSINVIGDILLHRFCNAGRIDVGRRR